jgi:hypothetical protein
MCEVKRLYKPAVHQFTTNEKVSLFRQWMVNRQWNRPQPSTANNSTSLWLQMPENSMECASEHGHTDQEWNVMHKCTAANNTEGAKSTVGTMNINLTSTWLQTQSTFTETDWTILRKKKYWGGNLPHYPITPLHLPMVTCFSHNVKNALSIQNYSGLTCAGVFITPML